ncbi:protein zwilch [Battus philenor]|uniref:protein zwilch n=1 Tax=Battus philenor TaxID=42288 RepID=UPI0035D070B7
MVSNSLLQQVAENYPKYVIEKRSIPSYVGMYTGDNEDAIFVYAKGKQSNDNDFDRKNNSKSDDFELTGSPLKLDLSLHTILDETLLPDEPQLWRKEESGHIPMDIEQARDIANFYNKSLAQMTKEDAIPMWILCNPSSVNKPLLLTIQSDEKTFSRGIVSYEGAMTLEEVDVEKIVEDFAAQEGLRNNSVNVSVNCKYVLSGVTYGCLNTDELLNAPHGGVTELLCSWSTKTLLTPYISCKVNYAQEVTVGHLASPCNTIWQSVTALHNINQLLVEITAAGVGSINLESATIRNKVQGMKQSNVKKRLNELLNLTEIYTYTAECPAGGCICITEDTNSLKQCLSAMRAKGSSNDFTYKLWDILRDCETAEELITLLLHTLKFVSSGKIRPFIDVNNKSYLSKLVLKLSRGHSQASKVLKNLQSSPPQALSLVAQVGMEKTMWEYTRVMTLLEHSFYINGIWNTDARTHESIEQINQTIQDMTMGGDFTLNPFESLGTSDQSIRLDSESFYGDDPNELTVDDFVSLKKHGLVSEKKDVNEVPLIADEIDISPWKNLLMKFAQVHVCLEHLYHAETCLRTDFAQLKPVASKLLEIYVSDKSPVKTVGQLMCDPVQKICIPITNNIVQDHLKKAAFWYRMEVNKKDDTKESSSKRDAKLVYVFSQTPVFPPSVWQYIEPPSDDVAEVTTVGEELKFHFTKYIYISNNLVRKLGR